MRKKANRVLAIIFLIFAIGVLAVGITWSGEVKTSMKDTELRLAEIQQDIDASADNSIISGSVENYNQNVKVYNSYLDMYDMGFKLIMTLIIADLVVVIILIAMDKADEEETATPKILSASEMQEKDKDNAKNAETKVKSEDVSKDKTKHRFGIKSGLEAVAKSGGKADGGAEVDLKSVVTNDMISHVDVASHIGVMSNTGVESDTSTVSASNTVTNVGTATNIGAASSENMRTYANESGETGIYTEASAEAKMQKTNLGGQSTIELTKQLRAYKNQLAAGKITEQEFIRRKEELLKSI